VKELNVSSESESAEVSNDEIREDDSTNVESNAGDTNVDRNMDVVQGGSTNAANDINGNANVCLQPDIFDPRSWGALDTKAIDVLVEKGDKGLTCQCLWIGPS
jgi:hypothetical protein